MSKNFEQIIKSAMNVETKQLDKASLDDFKDKNVMTFGTFDLFHIGHQKIIEHCLEICGEESRLFIAVSSDRWNGLKGKKSLQSQEVRISNLKKFFPKATILLEDHDLPEETWPQLWDAYDINLILMGGDHFENLNYINELETPLGNKMKISFYERTPNISSTLIRSLINLDGGNE